MGKLKRSIAGIVSAVMCFNMCMGVGAADADNNVKYYGDADGNGIVDLQDLTKLSLYLLSAVSFTDEVKLLMDVDTDRELTLADLALIKQYVVKDEVPVVGTPFNSGLVSTTTPPTDTLPVEITTEETTVSEVTTVETTTAEIVTTQEEPQFYSQVYYANEGEIYLGVTETVNGGFTGTSYVNYDNVTGSSLTLKVNVPADGNYKLNMRFANGTAISRPLNIYINESTENYTCEFEGTGAWTNWEERSIVVSLKKGENTIKTVASTANGGPNLDYIKVETTDQQADEVYDGMAINYNPSGSASARRVEALDRGLAAVKTDNGMLVSWRFLGTDDTKTGFKLYRDGEFVYASEAGKATTYLDTAGSPWSKYSLETYVNGAKTESSEGVTVLGDGYLDIKLNIPAPMTMPDGTSCTYSASDCSVGDVDGDGKYEIFVKWDPSNSKDNSQSGYTGNVYIDCYSLDGRQLWRIDLGKNIRAGAHYTQFMVYDFDGDGKCEMLCKTADGTKDGTGKVIGDDSKDYRNSGGYILDGNEYLTIFNGATGAAMDTINYTPARGNVNDWGDKYGNRVDRFLGTVAYLDGKTPSAVMCRGYYTRAVLVAYDWNGSKLSQKWIFDSTAGGTDKQGKPNSNYSGQGNHNLVAADVDGDGADEIIYGSCCIDHDGRGLYSTNLGHGDAIHVSDFLPDRPGLEVWQCHEHEPYGCTLTDAATGNILFRYTASKDTGRCCAGNVIAGNNTAEFWGSRGEGIYDGSGNVLSTAGLAVNFVVQWDGDLETELLDGNTITEYADNASKVLVSFPGVVACNGTKNTPNLTADLFGDWREEVILHTEDSSALRIYSTPYSTDSRVVTFMHDTQYRCSVAAENTAYNQPPHTSYFLGTGYRMAGKPSVYTAGN